VQVGGVARFVLDRSVFGALGKRGEEVFYVGLGERSVRLNDR
jgi:hypothetical protein